MTYNINHTTSYYYNNSVSLCHNLAHLTARDCPWQMCLEHDLKISSPTSVLRTRTDYFGNSVTFFTVQEPHKKLEITAHNLVRVLPRPIPDASATPPWEEVAASLCQSRDRDAGRGAVPVRLPLHPPRPHPGRLRRDVLWPRPTFPRGRGRPDPSDLH